MYNKLFSKILDSSVWLESNPTRIVWFTFLASMDEHGFCQFASVANLAHRAIVTLEEAQKATEVLSNPDPNSSDPDNEGRRIERVPGGWIVLNAEKYKLIVTRAVAQENTRKRVRAFRARNAAVTSSNAQVTLNNVHVTPSYTESDTHTESEEQELIPHENLFDKCYETYPRHVGKPAAKKAFDKALKRIPRNETPDFIYKCIELYAKACHGKDKQFIPHMATWLNQDRFTDDPKDWVESNGNGQTTKAEQRNARISETARRVFDPAKHIPGYNSKGLPDGIT